MSYHRHPRLRLPGVCGVSPADRSRAYTHHRNAIKRQNAPFASHAIGVRIPTRGNCFRASLTIRSSAGGRPRARRAFEPDGTMNTERSLLDHPAGGACRRSSWRCRDSA